VVGERLIVKVNELVVKWAYSGIRTGLDYQVENTGWRWVFVNHPSCHVEWDKVTKQGES